MSMINKAVRGLGKITGTSIKVVKNAPKKTINTSKDLKEAFVDGLKSQDNSESIVPKI